MALTPPQTMLVWALSGDLWFGRRELLQVILLSLAWFDPPWSNKNCYTPAAFEPKLPISPRPVSSLQKSSFKSKESNFYWYNQNNPSEYTDPSGLQIFQKKEVQVGGPEPGRFEDWGAGTPGANGRTPEDLAIKPNLPVPSKGNCFRYACNDPAKNNEEPNKNPCTPNFPWCPLSIEQKGLVFYNSCTAVTTPGQHGTNPCHG